MLTQIYVQVTIWVNIPRGGTPSLRVSRYAPRFCLPFSASGRFFLLPKIWPCLLFYSDLVGTHFEAPHFQHVDDLFAPKIDQIYHFIQILLGPVLNLEQRTPPDFDPECPGQHTWWQNYCEPIWHLLKLLVPYFLKNLDYSIVTMSDWYLTGTEISTH